MASDTNDNGDNKLISDFGQFIVHEMTQELLDRIWWVMKEQRLDRTPSVKMHFFLQFAAVQFVRVRFKVFAPWMNVPSHIWHQLDFNVSLCLSESRNVNFDILSFFEFYHLFTVKLLD